MYKSFLIFFMIFAVACDEFPHDRRYPNKLVGGRNAKPGEVKYLVMSRSLQSVCGGAIIDENFILTAAHCVNVNPNTRKLLQPFRVIAGSNVGTGYNPYSILKRDVEEAYFPTFYVKDGHDIAVLKLKTSLNLLKYHDRLKKLELPKPLTEDPLTYPTYENVTVKFAGYGDTKEYTVMKNGRSETVSSGTGLLQVANAMINDISTCKYWYRKSREDEMCLSIVEDTTKKTPQGVCAGDSGSPAVYNNNVVVGISSASYSCDNNKAPALFTRVSSYIPFIEKAMSGKLEGLVVYKSE